MMTRKQQGRPKVAAAAPWLLWSHCWSRRALHMRLLVPGTPFGPQAEATTRSVPE